MSELNGVKDNYILSKKLGPDMNNLFREKSIDIILSSNVDVPSYPSDYNMNILKKKLLQFEEIEKNSIKFVVNEKVAVEDLITKKSHEEDEGKKIILWLKKTFDEHKGSIIKGLKYKIFNGYVYIQRKGIQTSDIIDPSKHFKDKKLKYFKWQYGKSIQYDTLKYILFQNKFQKSLDQDLEQQKEAEQILSQEYIIAFQPQPVYQLWCVKRLLICWYADKTLQDNIRKIKVLINQWRAKDNEKFNKQHGVLPLIVVYPKYGYTSARKVISILSYYFSLYTTMGWKCSHPHYFNQYNELIYVTNGALDLKLYFRHTLDKSNNSIKNDSFSKKFTELNTAKQIFIP